MLGLSLAFILSQDQTLLCIYFYFLILCPTQNGFYLFLIEIDSVLFIRNKSLTPCTFLSILYLVINTLKTASLRFTRTVFLKSECKGIRSDITLQIIYHLFLNTFRRTFIIHLILRSKSMKKKYSFFSHSITIGIKSLFWKRNFCLKEYFYFIDKVLIEYAATFIFEVFRSFSMYPQEKILSRICIIHHDNDDFSIKAHKKRRQ